MILALSAAPAAADGVISAAAIRQIGSVVELRFATRGPRPRWSLDARGQELSLNFVATRIDLPPRPLFGRETAPVAVVRAIDDPSGRSRLVIEVTGKVSYALAAIPGAVVIRIAPKSARADLVGALLREGRIRERPRKYRTRTAAWTPPTPISPLPAGAGPLVVIDPGHGGFDPGTEVDAPVLEKNVALQIARRLSGALAARGVRAVMTRDQDHFLKLSQRTAIANQDRAALFISIHLNSSPNSSARGIETYYLNNTTDRATIRLAHMENAVPGGYGVPSRPNLNYILTDLRQQYKAVESASLARMIEADTTATIDAKLGLRVNDLGARKGPFYVLVGARMPAVLVECGFLSNPVEARRLTDPAYQQALADGIASAVVRYLSAAPTVGNL